MRKSPDRSRATHGMSVSADAEVATAPPVVIEHDLVDGYRLMLEPILLGGGKRLSPTTGEPAHCSWCQPRRDRCPDLHLPTGGPVTLRHRGRYSSGRLSGVASGFWPAENRPGGVARRSISGKRRYLGAV